ncbi:hypothetical protein B0T17DRAFT_500556 [Bombardia bombarda]|uniref:Zn(2)-C6 fungal-type domain-containing protein n=1 Tax=Bombardia bombarda TaxID=252184 RepID=A0AA39W9X0_9PEZI|nr:hypothetical protein B0T17DRAFT_500556 [Bombardia bombarda]
MPRLRLGYTKSRTGCLRCKQRRCDENRPCRACVRHGIECSLMTSSVYSDDGSCSPAPREQVITPNNLPQKLLPQALVQADTSAESSTAASSNVSTLSLAESSPATPDRFPYFAKFITEQPQDGTANWVSDLEMLHHYTTETYKTVALGYRLNIWQVQVPKLAFSHVFLLHQLLAVSAFHLAYLHPDNRQQYSLQASHHQSLAIQGISVALQCITTENCHALFPAASFLFVGALAASRPDELAGSMQGPIMDNLIDVFLLVRGIKSVLDASKVLDTSKDIIKEGPLGDLLSPNVTDETREPNPGLERLTGRLNKFSERLSVMEAEGQLDEAVRMVIEVEIASLIRAIQYAIQNAASPEHQIMASWPIGMADAYIGLLRQRCQPAVALVAYYCVVMHATEPKYWFSRGWSFCVLRDLETLMSPPWNQDTAWALGWIARPGEMR